MRADQRDPGHPTWGEPEPSILARLADALRSRLSGAGRRSRSGLAELPLTLRRGDLAERYLAAERTDDHPGAGATALAAMDAALSARDWWRADVWGHRALWHFERAELTLQAIRVARRIGELRAAAGDPASARRYYAEAIDEARDIGAEHEQGLAALGLGRALLELGDVTTARRLAHAATDLLRRSGAAAAEVAAAQALRGTEQPVGPDRGREEEA